MGDLNWLRGSVVSPGTSNHEVVGSNPGPFCFFLSLFWKIGILLSEPGCVAETYYCFCFFYLLFPCTNSNTLLRWILLERYVDFNIY